MQQKLLEAFPKTDFSLSVVWLDVLMFDSAKAAKKAQRIFGDDPRVSHFWDPDKKTGYALGRVIGFAEDDFAWDVYLIFGPEASWGDKPPAPIDFVHQLPTYSEGGHFQTGEDLVQRLGRMANALLAP